MIYGGADNDQLYGGAGSDLIVAGSGADTVYGEEDDDTIIGGAGIDMLYGDSGADLIAGGDAADLIMGGLGNDTLGGGAGDDTILGEIGDDQIIGGDGDDNISAGAGYDVMAGGLGDDILDGGADSDFYVFNSGDGFDEITDSAGDNDVIRFVDLAVSAISFVKSGDDLVISFAGNSTDQITIKDSFSGDVLNSSIETLEFTSTGIEGGDSIDLTALSYDSGTGDFTHAVTSSVSEDTDLQHVLIQDSEGQLTALDNFYHDSEGYTLGATEDNYVNVDYESYNEVEWRSFKKARGSFGGHYTVWYKYYESNMAGTTGVDRLVGSWWDENITGSESADYLYGNNGADVIYGEAGDDFIEGGDGADYLYGGAGSDVIEGAGGSDIIDGGAGDDRISTGEGADQVIAGAGNNVIIAEFGNNIIAADDGDNQIQAGSGNDQVAVGAGDNVINLGNGDNLLTAGDGANKIVSGDGDDEITVGDGDNQIDSGSGADEIVAGDGSNFIYSGEGNDQITVGDGSNQIYAGSGDDIIEVGAGDNEIYLGTGNDQLTVGAGNNVIIAEAGDNVITVMATSGNIDPLPDQASLSPTSPEAGSKKIEVESSYDPLPDEIEVVDALSYSPLEGESESGVAEGEDGSGEGQVVFTSIKTSDGNDNITISDGNSFIDAGDGNDVVILSDGDHELIAGDGDKNIRISEGNSDITLGDGDNVIDLNGEVLEFNSDYYIEHYGEFIPGLDETNDKANLALEHFQTIGKFNNYNPNNYLNLTSYAAILITAGIELAEGQTPYDQLAAGGSIEIASLLDAHIEVEEQDLSGTTNTVIIGNGNNVIYGDNSVNDIIIGDGDNQITSGRSDDQIIIGDGDNQIDSQAGSDQITIGDGDNQIDSGDGADQIIIGNGNNIITAGRGDDQIIAGDGDNILIYNKGDGSDQFAIGSAVEVALNSNTNIGAEGQFASNNIIQFADLDIADIALSKVDDDLLITISTTGEIITLSNYVDGNYTLQFSDDFEVELSNITVGSEFGDSLIGTEARDQILAAAGMDSLLGFGGSDYLAGDKGDDVIFGGMDDDAILGGEGNDYLDGGIGNDVLISGTGSDKMFGGAGLDKFIITKSPGATDKITDFNLAEDTLDLTAFGREFIDIKSLEDRASFNEKGDLVLDLGSQQSLVLQSSFPAGGTDLSSFNIEFDIEEIEGLTGSDSNDIIAGTDNGDVIIDGLGLDILTGGAGADKFVISKEAGAVDVITDFAIGEDKIHLDGFGEINIDQLTLAQSGDDAVIEFSQGQKLTLRNVDASMLSSLDFKFDVFDGIGEYERYQGEYDFIAPELKSNLIAYYDFDSIDKGYDSSGNNKHGSTTGNIVSVAGISGNAGFFNSNDKINVGAFSNFNWGSDFSVSVWFQRTGEFSNYQGIVNNGYYNNGSWEIRTGSELGGTTIGGGVNTSINPTAWDHVDITASVNQWHHVMMSYDGANLAYYLDGELIDISNQDSGDLLIKNTALTIGQAGFGKGGEYFYGAIDELSLYDTALTADDAALLYGNQITYGDISSESLNGTDSADIGKTYNVIGNIDSYDGLKDNLLAYYNFDSIDKGYDSSGNNRHGSTTGNIVSVAGISGNAGFFNGNDKIDVGAFSDFNWGSDFSVSVWFQRTGEFKNYQGIVNNGYYNNGSWEIRMGNEGSGTMLGGGVITQGNTQSWDHKNLTAATNTWHHVVMSYDGKNLAYYLDGALKDISGRDSGDMLIKNTVLTIGQAGTGKSNEYFYGAIDELSLYDKALSAADVALLFNNQVYGEALSDEDYIFAGAGNDHITTYSANDEVSAGSGEDNISAGMGDDLVNGGEGDDYLDGGYGADRLYGEEGNDFLITGADNSDNLLSGGEGHDNIVTFSGNNVIDGGTGSDKITAGFGNDIIYGNSGFDHITSGAGSDIVYGGTNDDVIDGGDGNDHLMGDSGDDQLLGSSGNDLLEGGSGDDILNGGLDADWLVGAAGDDILIGGAGNDTLSGGEGADAYIYNLGDGYDQVALGGDLGIVSDSLDVIRFGEGIAKADLVFSQKGDDLTITFSDYEGGLLLKGQFVNSTIATLEFADGLAVSLIDFSIINEDQSLPGSDVVIPENFNGLLELDGQTIWVTPVNDAPITEDITSNLDEDSSILIDISEYISDVDASLTESETTYLQGGNITLGKPLHGTVTLTEANQILYAPDSDYYGGDEFTYSFTDNLGITSTSKVTLTVNNIADIPIIVDNIELETKEDKSITIDANDYGYDADGETLTVLEVGEVTNGAVSIIDGKIIYTPNQDYSGVESFSYVVTDGETELSKNISLTITAENDAPVVVNSASEVDEDGVAIIDILRDVLDSEGDNLTITSISKPFFGAAELVDNKIIYIPDSDYNGEDFLIYTISDQNGGILTERLDITVNEVNDKPILQTITAQIAEDKMLSVDVLKGSFDIDGDTLSVTSVSGAEHGVATIIDNQIIYMANDNYYGTDSLEYVVSDGNGAEVSNILTITIAPVNDTPIAYELSVSTLEESEITINLAELIEDIDGEVFKRDNIILGSALYGSLTLNAAGEVTYRPDDNYFGLDNFTYSVKDQAGAYSEMAAIEIDVTNVNDAPVIWNKWKDPSVRAGEQNHIILPNDIFKDFDGDDISLSLAMADGSEIPGWVVFDDVNNVIITNPSDGDAGKLDLILSASDGEFTTDKEFSLAINKPLTVRENKKINIIEGSDDADLVTSESGVSDVIFAGAGDDNIIYNIDDLWGAGYYAENAYSGERVNLVGKIRSYDAFDGGDGDDTLYLTDGDDSIFLDDLISDNGTISGSRLFGIEVINALGGSDVIDLSSNIFTYGSVEINGSDGNDVIWSNDGNDEINAGGGNDNIHGGSGDDIINGGLGQDTLTGGVGSDIFDFTGLDESVKGNADVITDFESGADFIHLIDLGLSFADLEISNNNGSTFINDNNSDFSIEFHGIIDLSESDFIFGS
ncbi:MAG: tandem-95 repeat protein [Rickettsiales bacterium]|nr:tandem-95 repeat protein [Rickettsiales bacterium]